MEEDLASKEVPLVEKIELGDLGPTPTDDVSGTRPNIGGGLLGDDEEETNLNDDSEDDGDTTWEGQEQDRHVNPGETYDESFNEEPEPKVDLDESIPVPSAGGNPNWDQQQEVNAHHQAEVRRLKAEADAKQLKTKLLTKHTIRKTKFLQKLTNFGIKKKGSETLYGKLDVPENDDPKKDPDPKDITYNGEHIFVTVGDGVSLSTDPKFKTTVTEFKQLTEASRTNYDNTAEGFVEKTTKIINPKLTKHIIKEAMINMDDYIEKRWVYSDEQKEQIRAEEQERMEAEARKHARTEAAVSKADEAMRNSKDRATLKVKDQDVSTQTKPVLTRTKPVLVQTHKPAEGRRVTTQTRPVRPAQPKLATPTQTDDILIVPTQEFREASGILLGSVYKQNHGMVAEDLLKMFKEQQKLWADRARDEPNPRRKTYYAGVSRMAEMEANRVRVGLNIRPRMLEIQNILRDTADGSDATQFERFKRWAKRNMGNLAWAGIAIAGAVTAVAMGLRSTLAHGARAVARFATAVGKVFKQLGGIFVAAGTLLAAVIGWLATALTFLASNLWLVLLGVVYAVYEKYIKSSK